MNFTSMKVGADETAVRVRDTYARRRGRGRCEAFPYPDWGTAMPPNYANRCCSTYSCNASFMRVCHPSPVALKYSTTSGLYRTVTDTLVGRFCGPR